MINFFELEISAMKENAFSFPSVELIVLIRNFCEKKLQIPILEFLGERYHKFF